MVIILNYDKETPNKYRWKEMVDNIPFELYIPKWRVPEPCPDNISVTINTDSENIKPGNRYTPDQITNNPKLKYNSIFAFLELEEASTTTSKYKPIGDPQSPEIGNPYIPSSLLPQKIPIKLIIIIDWL